MKVAALALKCLDLKAETQEAKKEEEEEETMEQARS